MNKEEYITNLEKENAELFKSKRELYERIQKLESDYARLLKYTKHIQEYLCKDIMELIGDDYD